MSRPEHPLGSKLAWVRLGVIVVVAVFGLLTQFSVTVNESNVPAIRLVKAEGDLIDRGRDGKISKAECMGLEKHAGENWRLFVDTFGMPADDDYGVGPGEELIYPLSDGNDEMVCWLYFDYNDKLERVSMDLWINRDSPGNPFG